MRMNEYQIRAHSTAIYPTEVGVIGRDNHVIDLGLLYTSLGLVSEAGEVADKIKKKYRDNTGLDYKSLAAEVSDCLWYISELAHCMGYTLEDIAQMNLDKLESRQQRGKLSGSGDER